MNACHHAVLRIGREFDDLVNMTSVELENWLNEEQSENSGWSKDDGSNETIGHERLAPSHGIQCISTSSGLNKVRIRPRSHSWLTLVICKYSGRKIIEILNNNRNRDPGQYDEEDLQHMRKVVSYCKRHLAQEAKAKQNTDSKSYKSLKNWGHDPLKS